MSLVQIDQTGTRNAVNTARLDPTNDQVAIGRWNGTTFDTQTSNMEGIALATGVRAATNASADIINYNCRGVFIYFEVTSVPGTDTVQVRVDSKNPASGTYTAIFLGTATAVNGLQKYLIYPGAIAGTGGQLTAAPAGNALPRTFRFQVIHSAATNFTYNVGYCLIV